MFFLTSSCRTRHVIQVIKTKLVLRLFQIYFFSLLNFCNSRQANYIDTMTEIYSIMSLNLNNHSKMLVAVNLSFSLHFTQISILYKYVLIFSMRLEKISRNIIQFIQKTIEFFIIIIELDNHDQVTSTEKYFYLLYCCCPIIQLYCENSESIVTKQQ